MRKVIVGSFSTRTWQGLGNTLARDEVAQKKE